MLSGTAAGAVKPRTLMAIVSASATFMMSRAPHKPPIQDEYTVAAVIRFDECIEIKNSAQKDIAIT
jgi:hypothetical protein